MTKRAGSGSESGSISQKHGSEDPDPAPDPDPLQNVMDPEHWIEGSGAGSGSATLFKGTSKYNFLASNLLY
jgi:hypothetical protein